MDKRDKLAREIYSSRYPSGEGIENETGTEKSNWTCAYLEEC